MTAVEVEPVTDLSVLPLSELVALYDSVGWTVYTRDPQRLLAGLRGSSYVAVVRERSRLLGLVRTVSDAATVRLVQDLLVRPEAQRTGIASALLASVAERYAHVRQHVLLTDNEEAQRGCYERAGFAEIRDFGDGSLRSFVRYT